MVLWEVGWWQDSTTFATIVSSIQSNHTLIVHDSAKIVVDGKWEGGRATLNSNCHSQLKNNYRSAIIFPTTQYNKNMKEQA